MAKRKKSPSIAKDLADSAQTLRLAGNLAQSQLKMAETATKASFALGALNLKAASLALQLAGPGLRLLSRPWAR